MTATVAMMDLASCKKDFSTLLAQIQPWTLSHFVMWLDIKVAEYKVFGRMIMDNTPNDTPQWLRASADYLEQQSQREKTDATSTPAHIPPPLSPQSALRAALPNSTYEHINSFATTANSLYTVSTVNSTVVSPSVSPVYVGTTMAQGRVHTPAEPYKAPVAASPDVYAKPPSHVTQFQSGFTRDTQRIPSISHLSPKHIRQSHMDTMSLPVSLTPVTLPVSVSKEMMQLPAHLSKESLTTQEVETQIAVLESQIAAVNRNLKQSVQASHNLGVEPVALNQTPSKPRSRKVDPTDEASAPFVPPPYPKKTRQQSPVGNRVSVESGLPPLHSSMDMLARIHRLDSDSIPESLRSQNIQSTLEAFEALRTQTFPPNPETLRTQMSNEVETVQSTAQDMSIHHVATEREYSTPTPTVTEREPVYPVSADQEQIYAAAALTASTEQQQPESIYPVKIETDSMEENGVVMRAAVAGTPEAVVETAGTPPVTMAGDNQNYNMAMYASQPNATPPANADDKLQQDLTIKKMRRKFLESMKNSNPKYYSHQIQQIIHFPDKFPVSNLDYGLKALQMIQTGEITRAGKIQLIDTIFHELIKYTGLYPTPTQKMAVANSIVETFPTLAAKMKASHISPADSWYVILCDKFRNERRGLGGAGASPRVGKVGKMSKDPDSAGTGMPGSMEAPSPSHVPGVAEGMMGLEGTEDGAVEVRTEEVETSDETSQHALPSLPPPAPPYTEPSPAYQQQQQQQQQQQSYPAQPPQKELVAMETSEEEEEEPTIDEAEKLLMNAEERRLYAEQVKRSVRRKKASPKRVTKQDTPILDERYAASLLEYYSKHKPYYPVDGSDPSRALTLESLRAADQLVLNDKEAGEQGMALGHEECQEEYSAEVAAIVQSVVSAHMDEVIAARMAQGDVYHPQSHEAVSMETKSSLKKKIKPPPPLKDRTPEQQHVNMQRFRQKLAVTYPGVQAIDECTLLCTCNTKVKLGRARMLHNYTNYHLKRCQNPPVSPYIIKDDETIVTIPQSLADSGMYPEFTLPSMAATKDSVFLNVPDRENLQKHFTLTVPTVPTCEMLSTPPITSVAQPPDYAIPGLGQAALLNNPLMSVAAALRNATIPVSQQDLPTSASQSLDLSVTSSQSLDLSVTSTTTDLSIPTSGHELATSSMAEYSELPDLSAMNALTMIQGKADSEETEMEIPVEPEQEAAEPTEDPVPDSMPAPETTTEEAMIVIEPSQTETVVEEPINLADP